MNAVETLQIICLNVERITKEGAKLLDELIAVIKMDYGPKSVMRLCKYMTQGESRTGFLMSMLNCAIYIQKKRLNQEDFASWYYRLEHHMSKDTTQDASQLLLQIVAICDDLAKQGIKPFQFWLD